MARINITVPDEVKERMKNHPHINWSKAATECFINTMNSGEETMNSNGMAKAIARLLASKANFGKESREKGCKAGYEWAMNDADYYDLLDVWEKGYFEDKNNGGPGYTLKDIKEWGKIDNAELFQDIADDDQKFIDGFVYAINDVFEKVNDTSEQIAKA